MMGHRAKLTGVERDVFHRGWRRALIWTKGRTASVKRSFHRRQRRAERQQQIRTEA